MLENKEVKDLRLSPLMDDSSVVLFQLFVLEISTKTDKAYKVIYGWCIASTRTEIDPEIYASGGTVVYSTDDIKYSIYRLSLYHRPAMMVQLVNKLCACNSLKSSAIDLGLEASKLKFDVSFISEPRSRKEFVLRPIIFNETNTLITRNFYEKFSLYSPYDSVPSFSLIINNLAKLKLLQDASGSFFLDWEKALLACLQYLKSETTLSFDLSGAARWGNIEFINSQCSSPFAVHNVGFENSKDHVKINGKEVSVSKQVVVTVEPNPYTSNKKLLVNCFLTNGGQVTFDECKEAIHTDGHKLELAFQCAEPISQIAISIWSEDASGYRIWYKHSVPLIRQMDTTMGLIGTTGTIKSDWLSVIAKSNNKTKHIVGEAEKISRGTYSKISIGDDDLDPWRTIDREFGELIVKLSPPKSEGEFFPKGWSNESAEHGAISFLQWFVKTTDKAQSVMIQDPFFDVLGLDFLARTTNSSTQFTILTCTQVKSDDDNGSGTTEPNRATRIKSFLSQYPSILSGINLEIYDMRSTGSGDKNLLHDRYMFIFQGDELSKGFHLSNSIQGATKYHPLLITPIPTDILKKVNDHMSQTMKDTGTKSEVNLIPLVERKPAVIVPAAVIDEVSDPPLLSELNACFVEEKSVSAKSIDDLVNKLNSCEDVDFAKDWSTLGYFLARTKLSHQIVEALISRAATTLNTQLELYLKNMVTASYPIGYRDDIVHLRNAYHKMLECEYEECLKDALWFENYVGESDSFGNWGAYYASKVLIHTGFENYAHVIEFLGVEYQKNKTQDLSRKPATKLLSLIFTQLIKKLFWYKEPSVLMACISSELPCLQAISTASIISNSVRHEPKLPVDDAIKLIIESLEIDKALTGLCYMLFNHKKKNNEVDPNVEKKILEAINELLVLNFTGDRLEAFFRITNVTHYPFIEKKITEEILIPLCDKRHITIAKVFELWSSSFWSIFAKFETFGNYSGVLDLTAWSFCLTNNEERRQFLDRIKKYSGKCFGAIRKPFNKGTTAWQQAFEQLFLMETVLAIAALYDNKNTAKIEEVPEITDLITQIETLKSQFAPSFYLSNIQYFNNQIIEKYNAKVVF